MPRSARRYDIYMPLMYNDGRPVPKEHFKSLENRLLGRFTGVTSHQPEFSLRGAWQEGAHLYIDQAIVITALDFRKRGSTRFIAQMKQDLLREFEQMEILITESSLRVH